MQLSLKLYSKLLVLSFVCLQISAEYDIPHIKVEALKPKGLRVALPDDKNVQLFEFHANINKDIGEKEIGDIFNRVSAPYKGNWMFDDKTVSLKKGDTIHYWITVYNNGKTFEKDGLSYTVEDLVD